jgi:hypothetical protein
MKTNRIQTFDFIRGFAIILMILAHVLDQFLRPDVKWFAAITYTILAPWGIPGFVFASGLSFSYSWESKRQKGSNFIDNAYYSLYRTIVIIGIAFGFNLAGVLIHQQPWINLWYWYILQLLAITRLLGILIMRISKLGRLILAGLLFIVAHYLLMALLPILGTNNFADYVYFISFNPIDADNIWAFLPIFIIGTVCGEIVQQKTTIKIAPNENLTADQEIQMYDNYKIHIKEMDKIFLILGGICCSLGILTGLSPTTYFYGWEWIPESIAANPDLKITFIPLFLTRNSYAWLLYSTGLEIFTFLVVFHLLDMWKLKKFSIANKKISQSIIKKIFTVIIIQQTLLFGKYSLTIYLFHYIAYLIPLSLSIIGLIFTFCAFCAFLFLCTFLIERYTKGKFSIEYLINLGAAEITKKKKHQVKNEFN